MPGIINVLFGSKHEKDLKELLPLVHKINALEAWALGLKYEDFSKQTEILKKRHLEGESLDQILPEAFALVREASRRTLGERPYDVQLMGGISLHQGRIMEMKTGEGKTLSSVPAAYLNSLAGMGVHVITVNDYLAERDSEWMKPVFSLMGISVGNIISNMDNESRQKGYECDITYGTNNEFGFDYLRDNMRWSNKGRVQKHHNFCIIDEIDSILIDEARTPLIISGQADDNTKKFSDVNRLISKFEESSKDTETGEYPEISDGDFQVDEKSKKVIFTEKGMTRIEEVLIQAGIIKESLYNDENFEFVHYFTQALKAYNLFSKDVDYVVQNGVVEIVDEFTGRVLHGRRYSEGLHQAIEAKEGIRIARRNRTLATITFQNFFRMYTKISGMTGTADTEAREFGKIYNLDVVVIPTNRPLARIDKNDVIYLTEEFKYNAICDEIEVQYKRGQPVLVGTVSIEKSEHISKLLSKRGIKHEILNAKNHEREAHIIAEAGAKRSITIATNMAGRGTDIKLGGNPDFRARRKCGTTATNEEFKKAYNLEYINWRKDYEEVKELGGLYILGTERHESRRIDNQLRGRSGRQGDPGTSRFFLSLDDELMRLFARDSLRSLMSRAGMNTGEPLHHSLINKAIERAQNRVEERNYEIRKHLLEYDDVLNEQRSFIYDQRNSILSDIELFQRVTTTNLELVGEIASAYFTDNDNSNINASALNSDLRESFLYSEEFTQVQLKNLGQDQLIKRVCETMENELKNKIERVGTKQFNEFIKYQYLKNIDNSWQDHLESLEELREAVYLRTYAQKNPLLEYKLEGFDIFDKLLYEIKTNIAKTISKVKISEAPVEKYRASKISGATESHSGLSQFGSGQKATGNSASTPEKAQVKRTTPKVGRNDPCPCGSGKKYKHCHGK
ncbi:MAG: preprotein translocase subunit SecA [Spirochaetia bacterium]|jgi:preprotein translocase subunit SecA|nr:preprotein translocase subunit SecA [Spirochaetia bacterium]